MVRALHRQALLLGLPHSRTNGALGGAGGTLLLRALGEGLGTVFAAFVDSGCAAANKGLISVAGSHRQPSAPGARCSLGLTGRFIPDVDRWQCSALFSTLSSMMAQAS